MKCKSYRRRRRGHRTGAPKVAVRALVAMAVGWAAEVRVAVRVVEKVEAAMAAGKGAARVVEARVAV